MEKRRFDIWGSGFWPIFFFILWLPVQGHAAAGDLDTTFDGDGVVTTGIGVNGDDEVYAMALQSDGKIVVAGRSRVSGNYDFAIARYNADGGLDTTFGTNGIVTTPISVSSDDEAYAVAIQKDGKIVTVGRSLVSGNYDVAAVRYNTDGSLDTSFGTTGKITTAISVSSHDEGRAVGIQPDDKIIVAGRSLVSGNYDVALVRYNSDGSLDPAFDADGLVTTAISSSSDDEAYAVVLQPDGKVIAAGRSRLSGDFDVAVVRYNTDGSLDTTFDGDGFITSAISSSSDDEAYAVALQSDGKIVVSGRSRVSGNFDIALIRYETDGSLDTRFGSDGIVTTAIGVSSDDEARAIFLQPDGKIVVAGWSGLIGNFDFAVVRYTALGELDTTFSNDGVVTTGIGVSSNDEAYAVLLQQDGKLLAAGRSKISGNFDFSIARYDSDGTQQDEAFGVGIQSDGKIVAAGRSISNGFFDFALARYDSSGALDTGYDGDGRVTTDFDGRHDEALGMVIQSDNKAVVAGRTLSNGFFDFALARYNTDGSLDSTFSADGKVSTAIGAAHDEAFAIAVQPSDNKLVVAGRALTGNQYDIAVARYTPDGELDPSFGTAGIVTTSINSSGDDEVFAIAVQPSDNKLVVAGRTLVGAFFKIALVRYNPNGTLDSSFGSGGVVTTSIGSAHDEAYGLALQSDDKIVIGGRTLNNGFFDFAAVRYSSDGSPDTGFGTNGVTTTSSSTEHDEAYGVVIQTDGKIILTGRSIDGGFFRFALVRYNTGGTVDSGFGASGVATASFGSSHDEAFAVALQSADGKVVAVGRAIVSGLLDFALARFSTSGGLDAFGSNGKVTTDFTVVVISSGGSSGNGGCVMIPGEEGDWTLAGLLGLVLSILILRKFRRGFRF